MSQCTPKIIRFSEDMIISVSLLEFINLLLWFNQSPVVFVLHYLVARGNNSLNYMH